MQPPLPRCSLSDKEERPANRYKNGGAATAPPSFASPSTPTTTKEPTLKAYTSYNTAATRPCKNCGARTSGSAVFCYICSVSQLYSLKLFAPAKDLKLLGVA